MADLTTFEEILWGMETSVSGRGAPVVSKSGLRSQGTGSLTWYNICCFEKTLWNYLPEKWCRCHCRVKKHARKQFPLVHKIILLGCPFVRTFMCVFALQTLWALGWKQKRPEFDLCGKKKWLQQWTSICSLLFTFARGKRERKNTLK